MNKTLERLTARMPINWQQTLKRHLYAWRIRTGRFDAGELEYDLLSEMVSPGDWAVDIGANIGTYTLRLSDLVGATGRVIAFEPVPHTFELLASNVCATRRSNVTLINAALSDSHRVVGMDVPTGGVAGSANYYQAHLSADGALQVICLPFDALQITAPIRLVKIDAEGHELSVLKGMSGILQRDHPTLIIEGDNAQVEQFLSDLGYGFRQLPGSWNRIFTPITGRIANSNSA